MYPSKIFFIRFFGFVMLFSNTLQGQKNIDLRGWTQNDLPERLAKNKEIESIDLSGSSIKKLPEWLAELPNLNKLVLNETKNLAPLEASIIIAKCKNLTTLSWQNANLVFMPITLTKSKSITELNLANNGIFEFPKGFEKLPLTHLNVSNNLIDSLPSEILNMRRLVLLDFSYNTGTVNSYNYQLLQEIKSLKHLSIQGAFYLPNSLGLLKQLESLNLANGNFNTVPKELNELTNVTSLNIINCKQIKLDELFNQISNWKKLYTIYLGHPKNNRIPYNINKLYGLKKVSIWNSCLEELPGSFSNLKLQTVEVIDSKILNPEALFKQITKIKSLQNIVLKNITFGTSVWETKLPNLDTLKVINCNLSELHFSANKINYIDFTGNNVSLKELKTISASKQIGGVQSESIQYQTKQIANKTLTKDSSTTVYKKKVYASVGEIFNLPNGMEVNVPKSGFLNSKHQSVKGDVVMHFTLVNKVDPILLNNIPLHLPDKSGIDFKYLIKIEAYCEGKEVFFNQQNPILIKTFFDENRDYNAYLYDYNQLRWEKKALNSNQCTLNDIEPLSDEFKAIVLENFVTQQISQSNQLNRAAVYFKLKHNRRKNTLNFEMKPEYKYKSSYTNLLSNNTLAYPELKTYRDIRWNYVGEAVIKDLTDLVQLDPEPETEKINRKSTFSFTTSKIYNLTISPNPEKDNYLLQMALPNDTLTIEVIPYLTIIKPKKIQKWHKKRYAKYQKRLAKRVMQWNEMDSSYYNDKYRFQQKLQKASMQNIDSLLQPKKSEANSKQPINYTVSLVKTGWVGIGKSASINNLVFVKPEFYISDQKNYTKECIVYNKDLNLYYWSYANEIKVSKDANTMVYFLIGNKYIYAAPIHSGSTKINLQKL